jgi:two-component system OmpR family sensor kinase
MKSSLIKPFAHVRNIIFPRSLLYQLLSRILLILAALLLIIGLFQYVFMERFLYQNKAASIQRQILSVPGEIWQRLYPNVPRRGPIDAFIFFPASTVAFVNPEGKVTVLSSPDSTSGNSSTGSVPTLSKELYDQALQLGKAASKPNYLIVQDKTKGEQLVVLQAVRSFTGATGVVQVSTSTRPLMGELTRQLSLFLGLAFAALTLGLLTFLPAIRRTLVPLSRMVTTVEKIDSGKLDERLPENNQPMEVERLAHSFNRMLERLESSFLAEQEAKEQMRRFVADASHELRTPLTSIHGFLEVLLRGAAPSPEQLNKAHTSMYGESKRINKLVHDLLQLAKLDRAPELRLASCDLAGIVDEMLPQLELLADQRRVIVEGDQEVIANLDQDKIKQVVLNLFHNAVQHSDTHSGRIRIAIERLEDDVVLAIEDNGTGIDSEHLPHLFDRFYRIDTSRARKFGGAGLGLSISRSIVELHGGTLTVDSQPGVGSVFTITIPAY